MGWHGNRHSRYFPQWQSNQQERRRPQWPTGGTASSGRVTIPDFRAGQAAHGTGRAARGG